MQYGQPRRLATRSDVALVMDDREGVTLYGRNADDPRPIASLTKLMSALILIESRLPLDEPITITREDRDRLRGSASRIPYGTVLTRHDLLQAALGASDNRAAAALARTYDGGTKAFVAAMNAKARALGMTKTRFADASGLHSGNISTARDLARLVNAVREHALLRELSTTGQFSVTNLKTNRKINFVNTNRLVRSSRWDVDLSKTGYTSDAGNCLVMQTHINARPVTIVLLDSWGKLTKYGDATRIRDWLVSAERRVPRVTTASAEK